MVRNKSNINIKDKSVSISDTVLNDSLPLITENEYWPSRIKIADKKYLDQILAKDIKILENDMQFRFSCQETELVPYLTAAIDFTRN